MAEKFRLSSLKLDEISLVDRGGNQKADVVLFKRFAKADTCAMGNSDMSECDQVEAGVCKGKDCPMNGKTVGKADVAKAPAGLQFNLGFRSDGSSEIQSVIFNQDDWSEEDARSWLKDHNMSSGKVDTAANTYRFRQHDPEGYSRFRMITPGAQMAKTLKLGESFAVAQQAINTAIQAKYSQSGKDQVIGKQPWVRDLYEDSAIIDWEGETWRVGYTIDREAVGKLKVALAEPVAVEIEYQDLAEKRHPPQGGSGVPVLAPVIPVELLYRVGKMKAQIDALSQRVKKIPQ